MDAYSVVSLATMIATVVALWMVRKRKDYKYSLLDISGIILNTVLLFMIYPPMAAAGLFLGYERYATEPLAIFLESIAIAMGALVPAVSVAGIGASVILRRKERPGLSFLVQFAGCVWFFVTLVVGKLSGSY
jgi:hypothetical protein